MVVPRCKGDDHLLRNPFTMLFRGRLVVNWVPIGEAPTTTRQKAPEVLRPRPRVTPIKPKYDIVVCQICMGRVKPGLNVAKCECGKSFHDICLERTGFCPYCHRTYDAPSVAAISKKRESPKIEKVPCPSCGQMILAEARGCECGAVFVEDEPVRLRQMRIGGLRRQTWSAAIAGRYTKTIPRGFAPYVPGSSTRRRDMCECGAFTGDSCPECGADPGGR